MALSREQVTFLIKNHFLPSEINELSQAKTPDGFPQDLDAVFYSQPVQDAIASRNEWWNRCRKPVEQGGLGWSIARTIKELRDYYGVKKGRKSRSVWDFIKIEYRPTVNQFTQSQYQSALSNRIRIGRKFHGTYGKPIQRKARIYRTPSELPF